jgi:hypothetical protein
MVIPVHRLFFIIIEKEEQGKVMITYHYQWVAHIDDNFDFSSVLRRLKT